MSWLLDCFFLFGNLCCRCWLVCNNFFATGLLCNFFIYYFLFNWFFFYLFHRRFLFDGFRFCFHYNFFKDLFYKLFLHLFCKFFCKHLLHNYIFHVYLLHRRQLFKHYIFNQDNIDWNKFFHDNFFEILRFKKKFIHRHYVKLFYNLYLFKDRIECVFNFWWWFKKYIFWYCKLHQLKLF